MDSTGWGIELSSTRELGLSRCSGGSVSRKCGVTFTPNASPAHFLLNWTLQSSDSLVVSLNDKYRNVKGSVDRVTATL